MATLYGRAYTRSELLRLVGDMSQVARARPCRLAEGHEDGLSAVDVTTGGGLEFTVLPGRGLDVSMARHNGRSLAWRSSPTDYHPAFYEPDGPGWLRTFAGGLLTTCGLTWFGAPSEDDGRALGVHGRASHIPACGVHCDAEWQGDDYILSVSGKTREWITFGENVVMTRRIWARMGESRLYIDDVVENAGYQRTPHMVLYHCNIGFPVLAPGSRLLAPSASVQPRDDAARDGADRYAVMDAPVAGFHEKVYFHTMRPAADGTVTVALVNPGLDEGFGVYVKYDASTLPLFTQWKQMGEATYVVGIEPCNAWVMGRAIERAEGRLQFLEPGERREYHLEIGIVEGPTQVAAIEAAARG